MPCTVQSEDSDIYRDLIKVSVNVLSSIYFLVLSIKRVFSIVKTILRFC